MRYFGWFCVILGGLSFLGAVIAGHNVFGPLFWLAIGIGFLAYDKNKKEK